MNRILVAPLNWGLGHATRCIPIIKSLEDKGFSPVIASDGASLELLKKEFPRGEFVELPSYNIKYTKNGGLLKWKLLLDAPKILAVIKKENDAVNAIMKSHRISGIISDNRYGVYNSKVPSVIVTHQINVLSGATTRMSSKINHQMINKFDECWIPDVDSDKNLSGKLSRSTSLKIPTRHLGVLSRFKPSINELVYDLLILLSGPEPQRSLLETRLLEQLKTVDLKTLLVSGLVEGEQKWEDEGPLTKVNFLLAKEAEAVINQSKLILSRSGYSTIMDLAKLGKKAFFIPTPGQSEQSYLAEKFKEEQIAPFCKQEHFSKEALDQMDSYKGFDKDDYVSNLEEALSFFKGE